MKLFDNKTFEGWFHKGTAYGIVIGVSGVEFIRAVIRLVQAGGS